MVKLDSLCVSVLALALAMVVSVSVGSANPLKDGSVPVFKKSMQPYIFPPDYVASNPRLTYLVPNCMNGKWHHRDHGEVDVTSCLKGVSYTTIPPGPKLLHQPNVVPFEFVMYDEEAFDEWVDFERGRADIDIVNQDSEFVSSAINLGRMERLPEAPFRAAGLAGKTLFDFVLNIVQQQRARAPNGGAPAQAPAMMRSDQKSGAGAFGAADQKSGANGHGPAGGDLGAFGTFAFDPIHGNGHFDFSRKPFGSDHGTPSDTPAAGPNAQQQQKKTAPHTGGPTGMTIGFLSRREQHHKQNRRIGISRHRREARNRALTRALNRAHSVNTQRADEIIEAETEAEVKARSMAVASATVVKSVTETSFTRHSLGAGWHEDWKAGSDHDVLRESERKVATPKNKGGKGRSPAGSVNLTTGKLLDFVPSVTKPGTGAAVAPWTVTIAKKQSYAILDDWLYIMDKNHRVIKVLSPPSGILKMGGGEARDSHMSDYVRFMAKHSDAAKTSQFADDAGHIRAKELGGSVDPLNLVAMGPNTNQARSKSDRTTSLGCYRDAELATARMVRAGCKPAVEIDIFWMEEPPIAGWPGARGPVGSVYEAEFKAMFSGTYPVLPDRPTYFKYTSKATVAGSDCVVGKHDTTTGEPAAAAKYKYVADGSVCLNLPEPK